jgi:hypothetical protein
MVSCNHYRSLLPYGLQFPWTSSQTSPPFNSYDSILMVVDYLTKMVHFIPCTKIITDKRTSKLLFNHVFGYHSLSQRYNFLLWALIYTRVLEITIWSFRCEGEVVINFPPPNRWTNKTSQSNLGTIFTMHNHLSSK